MSKKMLGKLVFACIILILAFLIVYSGLRIMESAVLLKEEQEMFTPAKTIKKDGVSYFPRQDITVLLIQGVDQEGVVTACEPNYAEGVDMIALAVFDEANETITILTLNRDTMLNVPILDTSGRENGYIFGQLTMSHMYGTGLEDSCENTKKTVSNFLRGVNIDYYIAINMDAIPLLNDAVGGVTVTVRDDFSQVDPSLVPGVMTLRGRQALNFVQARYTVGDQLNTSRMVRQEEYMNSFARVFREKLEQDETFLISAYEEILPYMVTDCSVTVLSNMASDYADYTLAEFVSPEGQLVLGEQYYEFYPDEEKLEELILRLFYAPKE